LAKDRIFLKPWGGEDGFLEKTLTLLRQRFRVAALVGDLATENLTIPVQIDQYPIKASNSIFQNGGFCAELSCYMFPFQQPS
jgi:hypothetical protein